jgi:iron(III) transport system permease protein
VQFHKLINVWFIGALITALIVAMPLFTVLGMALTPEIAIWRHLVDTVLFRYLGNTLALAGLVGIGTTLVGVGTAWLVTMCRFPARKLFEWTLLLPFAVPTYVIAYVYTDQMEYAGPVQTALRTLFGWQSAQDYWFPEIRSLGGAALMFTLVLYPYVYLLSRTAFLAQSVGVLEVSRTLGHGPWGSLWRVALPLARPAIIVGVALALMETMNDFGTVEFFAVPTLTLGIFNVWFGMGSAEAAAQLAMILLVFVMVLIGLERVSRSDRQFQESVAKYKPLSGYQLTGSRAFLAFMTCALPIVLGFVIPAMVLGGFSVAHYEETLKRDFIGFTVNSVMLSVTAAIIAVTIATFMAYALRLQKNKLLKVLVWIASLGYGVPGAVLAVGAIIPLAWFDNSVDGFMRSAFGISTGLLLSGTLVAVIVGYVVRFLAMPFGTLEAGLSKITTNMDDAARSLGYKPLQAFWSVHLPMLKGSVLTAALIVFVDCMKELPMTLLLRPFNFQTLATFVYQFASDELLEEAALGALAIVVVGIGPVLVLTAAIRRSRPGS